MKGQRKGGRKRRFKEERRKERMNEEGKGRIEGGKGRKEAQIGALAREPFT